MFDQLMNKLKGKSTEGVSTDTPMSELFNTDAMKQDLKATSGDQATSSMAKIGRGNDATSDQIQTAPQAKELIKETNDNQSKFDPKKAAGIAGKLLSGMDEGANSVGSAGINPQDYSFNEVQAKDEMAARREALQKMLQR